MKGRDDILRASLQRSEQRHAGLVLQGFSAAKEGESVGEVLVPYVAAMANVYSVFFF